MWGHNWEAEPLPPRKKELWHPGADDERRGGKPDMWGAKGKGGNANGKKGMKRHKAGKGWDNDPAQTRTDNFGQTYAVTGEEQNKR